jgi:hypothetical protein
MQKIKLTNQLIITKTEGNIHPQILYSKTITGISFVSRRHNALDAKSVPSLLRRTSSVHPVYKTMSSGIKSPTETEVSTTDK